MLGLVIYMIHDSDKSQQAINVHKMFFFFSLSHVQRWEDMWCWSFEVQTVPSWVVVPCDCCICFT